MHIFSQHPPRIKEYERSDLLSDPLYFVELLESCICYSIIYVYICTYNTKKINSQK